MLMLTCWRLVLLSLMGMCFPEKVLEKVKLINHQSYISCFKGGTTVCAKPSDTWCQTNLLVVPEEKSGDRQSLQDSSSTAQFVKKWDLSLSWCFSLDQVVDRQANGPIRRPHWKKHHTGSKRGSQVMCFRKTKYTSEGVERPLLVFWVKPKVNSKLF